MAYNAKKHRRRSIRLKGYPYSKPGLYFVTFATYKSEPLFGDIMNGDMRLNRMGNYVIEEWLRTEKLRPNVELGEYIIMPDHIHAIIKIKEWPRGYGSKEMGNRGKRGRTSVRPYGRADARPDGDEGKGLPPGSKPQTLGSIIRGFKSASAKRINEMRGTPGKRVWHRNYYERIIREGELNRIEKYISKNPR